MALKEYEVNNDKIYRVATPETKILKSQEDDYIELGNEYVEKSTRKRPYGHKEYQRTTPTGKISQIPAKGVKPADADVLKGYTLMYGSPENGINQGVYDVIARYTATWPKKDETFYSSIDASNLHQYNAETTEAQKRMYSEYDPKDIEKTLELNRLHTEIWSKQEQVKRKVLRTLQASIIETLEGTPMGVGKSDNDDLLVEVFIGSNDGKRRVQSKVSVFMPTKSGSGGYPKIFPTVNDTPHYMLRNENETKKFALTDDNTVEDLVNAIKTEYKNGFWD